jgi:aspartate ammonia-lyase
MRPQLSGTAAVFTDPAMRSVGIVTALNPVLGYDKATELANEAYKSGKGILEIIREKKLLTGQQIRNLLDPAKLTMLVKSIYPKPKR